MNNELSDITNSVRKLAREPVCGELSPGALYLIHDLLELHDGGYDLPLVTVAALVLHSLAKGSLCLDLTPDAGNREFQDQNILVQCNTFIEGVKNGRYSRVVGQSSEEFKPFVLAEIAGKSLLYFYRYYVSEQKFAALIRTRLASQTDQAEPLYLGKIAQENTLGNEKLRAIRLALEKKLVLITGGPGTGKTYTAAKIVYYFHEYFKFIHRTEAVIKLAAPTGKAAKRLGEEVSVQTDHAYSLEGETIHRLLRYQEKTEEFYYTADNPLSCDLLIVDEVSMIDINLFSALLDAVAPETTLVLLGDRDQLPSVDAGAVLADLLPECHEGVLSGGIAPAAEPDNLLAANAVFLYAQKRSNRAISAVAEKIRQGNQDFLEGIPAITSAREFHAVLQSKESEPLYHITLPDTGEYLKFLDLLTDTLYLSPLYQNLIHTFDTTAAAFAALYQSSMSSRMLTILREGIYGMEGINKRMLARFAGSREPSFSPPGTPVMLNSNEYHLNLFNGDTGVIARDTAGVIKAFFPAAKNRAPLGIVPYQLSSLSLSFAVTIHKSQGSEYDDVYVVVPEDENHPLLSREILYTAVTRARKRVFFIGHKTVFASAAHKKIQRFSGLRYLLG